MAAVSSLALTSCEDLFENGSLQPDGSKPSITVNNPSNNQTVTATNGLRVNITAVDKDQFKGIDFVVKAGAGEKPLVNFTKFADKAVLEFDTLLTSSNFMPGSYTLIVTATDKRTNVTVQEVKFNVK